MTCHRRSLVLLCGIAPPPGHSCWWGECPNKQNYPTTIRPAVSLSNTRWKQPMRACSMSGHVPESDYIIRPDVTWGDRGAESVGGNVSIDCEQIRAMLAGEQVPRHVGERPRGAAWREQWFYHLWLVTEPCWPVVSEPFKTDGGRHACQEL